MKKYRVSFEAVILAWLAFVILTGVGLFVVIKGKWNFVESLVLFSILEFPMLFLFPVAYQTIEIDNEKISLCLLLFTFRSFLWTEVNEIGMAYTRAGYGTYKKFIYISKRPVTNKERFNLSEVKDHKTSTMTGTSPDSSLIYFIGVGTEISSPSCSIPHR